jgi:hypothetical protein
MFGDIDVSSIDMRTCILLSMVLEAINNMKKK